MADSNLNIHVKVDHENAVTNLKAVQNALSETGEQTAIAGRGMAGALMEIAHHGDLSGRSIKELVRGGAELVTMFGTTGPLLAGVALIGVAFYEAFAKSSEALKKATGEVETLIAANVRLDAEMKGDKLGIAQLDIYNRFKKEFEKVEEDAPGWGSKFFAGFMRGLGFRYDVTGLNQRQQRTSDEEALLQEQKAKEMAKAQKDEGERRALADASAFASGPDGVHRFEAQMRVIELERQKAIDSGEMSEEAADARAAGKRQSLVLTGTQFEQKLRTEVAQHMSALTDNVFTQRTKAESARYEEERAAARRLTVSEEERGKILDDIINKHVAITLEIDKQRQYTRDMGHADALKGSSNPVEAIQGELAAIELKKTKNIEAGMDEVDAVKIAENEKQQVMQTSIDASVKGSQSLRQILTQAALDPIIKKLEGIAIDQGIEAMADAASFNFAGAALHAAAAGAAFAGAREVASLGGMVGGGSSGGSSPGGAFNGGQLSQTQQNLQAGRGTTTVVLKGKYMDASDHEWMDVLVQSIREAGDNNILVTNG